MPTKLTEISGIGAKTAEKLKQEDIRSAEEAVAAYEQRDPAIGDLSSRARIGVLEFGVQQRGSLFDPFARVQVTEENLNAVKTFIRRDISDISESGRITRNNPSLQDNTLLDLGRKAARGRSLSSEMTGLTPSQQEISDTVVSPRPQNVDGPAVEQRSAIERRQARRDITEFGLDVAANVSEFDREIFEEVEEGEFSSRGRRSPKTDFTRTETFTIGDETKETEKDIRVSPREVAAAKRVHNARRPMAKRVDNRERAEVTGDFQQWVRDPRRNDFPGVDTPERGKQAGDAFGFTPDETTLEARVDFTPADQDNEFQVQETSTDGGAGRVSSVAGDILTRSQDEQKVILADLIPDEKTQEEIGLEPKGPDEDFFGFSDPLVRPEGPNDEDDSMDLI